ncbi:hypothetical protein HNQ60_001808 [Povalibacter uvarum]|uniref:Anti-sigma factor n=1 Tax=Povalibacter uvarum TaxID=732238 RepID=A0A841HKV8_9GAMM|nr:hypothetical protein [Povalibacter uvarum]MBB6092930.1 hypothetical protein [Povalibacter uvarum]
MDRKYIDDHHVVARYLADQLPDDERAAFETYYLAHPEIVRELEATARFKVGLGQLRESGELTTLLQHKPWFRQERYQALAASVALVAIALFLFIGRAPSLQPVLVASATALTDRLGDPLAVAASYDVIRMRSASSDPDTYIELPASAQVIPLRVEPQFEARPARYRIRLLSVGNHDSLYDVGTIAGLTPDPSDGYISVYLNSARLVHGRYALILAGDAGTSAENDESSFLIQVIDGTP